jgi:hypothetical protein
LLLARRAYLLLAAVGMGLCAPAIANPVPADEISLLSGAEHFERLCTHCHGWDPSEQHTQLYSTFPGEEFEPIIVLPPVDSQQAPAPGVFDEEVIDDWPEWAGEPPGQPAAEEETLRSELLEEFNAAIDAVYGDDADSGGGDAFGDDTGDYAGGYGDDYSGDYFAGDISDELDERYLVGLEAQERRVGGATDLTDPRSFIYGTTEAELFRHIAYGTGPMMRGFLADLGSEDAVWDLVNYIRSLWDEDWEEE